MQESWQGIIPVYAGLTKRGRPNIEGIAQFQAIRKNGSIVKLTVRKIRDDKNHLYTVELTDMELERPSKLRTRLDVPSMALEDGERPANQAPTRKPSSNSNIPRKSAEVNENPLIQGEPNTPVKLRPGERPALVPNREGRLPTATLGPKKPKGHFKGDRVTRAEIFERAREIFGTIRTGRTGRGLNGQYDRGADVARTAQYGQGSSPRMRGSLR